MSSIGKVDDFPSAVQPAGGAANVAIALGQYALAAAITLGVVVNLYCLWRGSLWLPLSYDGGDTMLIQTWCKSVIDHGWYLHNPNLGAPHGQFMEDFPQADSLNYLIVKFFGLFSHHPGLVINLFSLSTYVLTTWSALAVMRHFRIAYPPALAAALLYSLLPYHFARLNGHHFLACYQVVPLSVMVALWLYLGRLPWPSRKAAGAASEDGNDDREAAGSPLLRWCLAIVICLMQGSAGVYYAFFAEYFLLVGGLAASLQRKKLQPLLASGVLFMVTLAAFAGNMVPSLAYWKEHGKNPTVASRVPRESEIYGFKMAAMMLPIPGHRAKPLANLRDRYERETAILSESTWSAQGLVANVGFVVLLGLLLYRKPASRLLEALSVFNIFGILFATIGGFGMLFSLLVSPQIRSQNRISVFLSFFSLCCVAILLQALWSRVATTRRRQHLVNGLLIALVCVALWDQFPRGYRPDYARIKNEWARDANFVAQVEAAVPEGAMIYQVPYAQFPEGPMVHQHRSYPALRFYLHSSSLRWSAGAMGGREGDLWQQKVAALPLPEQLQAVAEAGFQGIQVARRGYADAGKEIEQQLREQLGVEPIVSDDQQDSFFPLHQYLAAQPTSRQ
jgi:phosphoglycerol transferase